MKKNMKRFTSMLLTSAMVMGMGLTTFAAPETTTLTINGVEGHTYYAYQMLTGELSGLGANGSGTGTLANIEPGYNLKDCAKAEGEADGVINKTDATAFETAIKDLSGTELSSTAMGYIKDGVSAYADTKTENSYTLTVPTGYYVVIDRYKDSNTDCAAYMVAVAGPTTMNPKTDTPDIDKNIIDTDANAALEGENADSKKTDTAAIGDTIEYELTSTVPVTEGYKWYYYYVEDTLSEGLTLNQDSFEVTITEKNADGTVKKVNNLEAGADKDYSLKIEDAKDEDGNVIGTTFRLAIMDMKKFPAGADISIKYTATVNSDALIGVDPNTNTVKLHYTNNPEDTFDKEKEDKPEEPGTPNNPGDASGVTPSRTTKTYVTELTINKVDENGEILNGAEFTLTGENLTSVKLTSKVEFVAAAEGETGEYYKLKDGTYTKVAPNPAAEGQEGYNANKYESGKIYNRVVTMETTASEVPATGVVATLENGTFTITGLNAGDYTLTETKTPAGYNTIDPIEFEITAGQTGSTELAGGAITWGVDGDDAAMISLDAANGVYSATIENVKGNLLPSTGGIGTTIFYVMGTILSLGAGVILVAKKRIAR